MNLVDLMRGMFFGYGLKLLQIAATLVVVPFILDELGLDRYGRIFVVMSVLGVTTIATDGLKLSFARTISQSIADGPAATARFMGAGLKAMLLVTVGVAVAAMLVRVPALELLGVPVEPEYVVAWSLAGWVVVVDSGLFSFHAYLTARGRLDLINALTGVEVILRNLAFVIVFMNFPPDAGVYLAIFLTGSFLRYGAMIVYSIRRWPQDFSGMSEGRLRDSWAAVSYSLPLTLDSVQHYAFQRFSIPLVNRFIGPAEAGLLALGINTISNNLAQVLFTVARPLLVPIAARLDLETMASSTRRLLLSVDALFAVCVASTMVPLIAVMPTVIGTWLGPDYDVLSFPAQILVAGTTVNVSYNVRRSLLIGQGFGAAIARVSVALSVLSAGCLAWALLSAGDWVYVTLVIAAFSALTSTLAVGLVFERRLLRPEAVQERGALRRTLAWCVAIGAAIGLSRFAPAALEPSLLIPATGSIAVVVLATHFLVIPIPRILETVAKLRGNARRSLFADER